MQIKTLSVLTLILFSSPLLAANAPESAPAGVSGTRAPANLPYPADLSFLFDATQNNSDKTFLSSDGGSSLIDFQRERERFSREVRNEQDLSSIKKELSEKLGELEKIRQDLSKEVKQKTDANDNLLFLVKLYETMSPDKVASLLKQMPLNVSLEMIRRMKPKVSSQVLAAMDERYASEIGRRLLQTPSVAVKTNP